MHTIISNFDDKGRISQIEIPETTMKITYVFDQNENALEQTVYNKDKPYLWHRWVKDPDNANNYFVYETALDKQGQKKEKVPYVYMSINSSGLPSSYYVYDKEAKVKSPSFVINYASGQLLITNFIYDLIELFACTINVDEEVASPQQCKSYHKKNSYVITAQEEGPRTLTMTSTDKDNVTKSRTITGTMGKDGLAMETTELDGKVEEHSFEYIYLPNKPELPPPIPAMMMFLNLSNSLFYADRPDIYFGPLGAGIFGVQPFIK